MDDSEAPASRFEAVPVLPPNAIFDINARYARDTAPDKLLLGVGAYRDAELKPYVFECVSEAKRRLLAAKTHHEYLPIVGMPEFRLEAARLALGDDSAALSDGCVSSCQAIGGTGALRIAAEALRRLLGDVKVYIPTPTWGNHRAILLAAGFPADDIVPYNVYDPVTKGMDMESTLTAFKSLPPDAVVLLQACAFNPTGVDPTPEQWDAMLSLIQSAKAFPLFDMAYQGFASGDVRRDNAAIRLAASRGMEMFVAQSFSKNMGLYGERVGCLHMVTGTPGAAAALLSQVEPIVRSMYSNPPKTGAAVVAMILATPELRSMWTEELRGVYTRLHSVREELVAAISRERVPGDWSHITKQRGMFSFTGLTRDEVTTLEKDHHVYMLGNGRISLAGLNSKGCDVLAAAIARVVSRTREGESPTEH